MPRRKEMHVRLVINMPEGLAARVEDYRFDHRIEIQAEAIRVLIDKGLAAEGETKRRKGGQP